MENEDCDELGSVPMEAYAHLILENNYFSWLLEFRAEAGRGDDSVITEYQLEDGWETDGDAPGKLFDSLIGTQPALG